MVTQYYPFDIKKFPVDDDDILLTEDDLQRKNVVYCRQEILEQMKCTSWAKEEYLMSGLDPEKHNEWFHYHLNKCYTPYMNAVGCLLSITDKEVQRMKKEAGTEGWKTIESQFIQDAAKTAGENNAKLMWELANNLKKVHETTRQRDGPLYGEHTNNNKSDVKNSSSNSNGDHTSSQQQEPRTIRPRPFSIAEAMGVNNVAAAQSQQTRNNSPAGRNSHAEVEDMFFVAKEEELKERVQHETAKKKSFWSFGST